MKFQTGHGGVATLGSYLIPIETWKVTATAQAEVFRNSKSGGHPLREAAGVDVEVEITFEFDFDANPLAETPGLRAGGELTNVHLPLRSTGLPRWEFPHLLAERVLQEMGTDGRLIVKILAHSSGVFSYPA